MDEITNSSGHPSLVKELYLMWLACLQIRTPLEEVQKLLRMSEGFDVGLEMFGNAVAFRDMIATMSHGGKIAMLGIPTNEMLMA
jgi:threonine dehydrogenase-like Zn-dependent dehydrogenase